VRVNFVDDVAVSLASISTDDIVVIGPGGTPLAVTEVSVSPPRAASR
jgi:hypothetical protein